jgi:hypothetical protein
MLEKVMSKQKSLLDLVSDKVSAEQELQDWQLTAEWQEAIEAFGDSNKLNESQKDMVAEIVVDHLVEDEEKQVQPLSSVMTLERMCYRYSDEDFEESLNVSGLDAQLVDMSFASKYQVVQMLDQARYEGLELQGFVDTLTESLTKGSDKQKVLDNIQQEYFKDMGKEMMQEESVAAAASVYKTDFEDSFLLQRVFAPTIDSFRRQVSNVNEAASASSIATSSDLERSTQASSSFSSNSDLEIASNTSADRLELGFRQDFVKSLHDNLERREEISKSAVDAVNTLDLVQGDNGKYEMSDDNPDDKVDITKDPDTGKYKVMPGAAFTGVIKMKRDVADGDEASFDIIEFKDGIMISGIEGSRGESKIENIAELKSVMVASYSQEPPLFIASNREQQEKLFEPYTTPIFESYYSSHHVAEQDEALNAVSTSDEWMERRYQLKELESKMLAEVARGIEPVKKQGMHVPVFGSSLFHKEHGVLVGEVTSVMMNSFAGQTNIPIEVLTNNQEMILNAARRVVEERKEELESVLRDPEVQHKPSNVEIKFRANQELVGGIARAVQEQYANAVARDGLRQNMMQEMQDRFPPEASFYRTYTAYRDTLVNHIVDKAMQQFPMELDAKAIDKHRDAILEDFHKSYESHEQDIRKFLHTHKSSFITSPDVSTARGKADLAVWEEVARDTSEYAVVSSEDARVSALNDLMNDIKDRVTQDVKPATWGMGLGEYWVERNALVWQMLLDVGIRIKKDTSVTNEMMYNNREEIIQSVREQIAKQQSKFREFLGKQENKNQDTDTIRATWKKDGKSVTEDMGAALIDSLRKPSDTAADLLVSEEKRLRAVLFESARNNIDSKEVDGVFGTTKYYVERDAMAELIVNQVMEDLQKKELSGTDLKVNHDRIVDTFKTSLKKHGEVIQERLEHIYRNQTSINVGHSIIPSARREQIAEEAVEILQGRREEVSIADDIALKFSKAVSKGMHKAEDQVRLGLSEDAIRAGVALSASGVVASRDQGGVALQHRKPLRNQGAER